jgi:hypothetical protein
MLTYRRLARISNLLAGCLLGAAAAFAATTTLGGVCPIATGSGSPEGVVTAVVCSLYQRTDGGAATSLYVKESGSGNTGWTAVGASATSFPLQGSDGTKTLPTYSWSGATSTGWYRVGTGEVDFSLGNVNTIDLQGSVLTVPQGNHIGWSTSTDAAAGEQTYFTNVSAGCVKVTGVGITSGYNAICAQTPTFTSGCGGSTGRTISGSAFAFVINVGSASSDTSCVLGLPNLNNGWSCRLQDQTTVADLTNQTANTGSNASFTSTLAWSANDKLIGSCIPF